MRGKLACLGRQVKSPSRRSRVLAGLSYGKLIGVNKDMVGAGLWYKTGDAMSPYLFMEMKKVLIGISYDIAISDLSKAPKPARSMEMSLQWRLGR
jgi:hypothetical protein